MQMTQSKADPCVFYKFNTKKELILMASVTVDDCAISGNPDDIKWFMDGVETRFKITREYEFNKHLGVEYEWGEDDNGWMFCNAAMKKKANAIVDLYKKYAKVEVKEYDTPGTPNENLI